jgi:hypothetical protein
MGDASARCLFINQTWVLFETAYLAMTVDGSPEYCQTTYIKRLIFAHHTWLNQCENKRPVRSNLSARINQSFSNVFLSQQISISISRFYRQPNRAKMWNPILHIVARSTLLVDRTTRWKTTVRNRALGYLSCVLHFIIRRKKRSFLLHSTAVRLRALSNVMYYLHPLLTSSKKKNLHLTF